MGSVLSHGFIAKKYYYFSYLFFLRDIYSLLKYVADYFHSVAPGEMGHVEIRYPKFCRKKSFLIIIIIHDFEYVWNYCTNRVLREMEEIFKFD